ncbi:MAG: heme-copper oxidase subunit III [Phycisphaeraceae bacterium]
MQDSPAPHRPPPQRHTVPPGTGTLGMWLFLLSLGMLFAGSMAAYLLLRVTADGGPAIGEAELPRTLWASTAIIIVSSFTLHAALRKVRREHQLAFRRLMVVTCALALAFLVVQVPSLVALLEEHLALAADEQQVHPAGLIFFLILVHAAHVVGGVGYMAFVTRRAHGHRYDHEHHAAVKHLAMYWHFLDGVWLLMFAMFLVAG